MPSCCPANTCCETKIGKQATLTVALVGNPNCGKTTLFNALTGAQQCVGNWPGVTVERKSGYFTADGTTVEVVDLPGVYSLTLAADVAVDERIACEYILQCQPNIVINIIDASNLERHLYLTIQLLEMGVPVIVALNMMDMARQRKMNINVKKLTQELGCPVVPLEAHKGNGLRELQRTIVTHNTQHLEAQFVLSLEQPIQQAIADLSEQLNKSLLPERFMRGERDHDKNLLSRKRERGRGRGEGVGSNTFLATRLLEDDIFARNLVDTATLEKVAYQQAVIQQALNEDPDILLADARYQFIQQLIKTCVTYSAESYVSWTTRIDGVVLNRLFGIPIFLAMMYCLFFFAVNIGGAFQDFFDLSSQTIFVDGFAWLLYNLHAPAWLTALLANGIGKGINTTLTFIPVIGALFLFLALLEDSGYMARAAFIVDRFMRALGLPGKAFVPMIVGFGCNVPAVMGARTLENKRDRILTIMMSPFMSCGARLAIFAVFTTAFFPQGGQNIVFALYLIGILMAIFTGFILRKTLLKGDPAPLIMELPPYHVPRVKTLFLHAWQRLRGFVIRAGKLIVPICVLLGALNTINIDGTVNTGEGDAQSLLSLFGQSMTPLFAPMGIHADNWPATVGLLTGVLAKEVVIGTLNTLYTQMGQFVSAQGIDNFQFWAGLQAAFSSIPQNLMQLSHAFSNPILAQAPSLTLEQNVYGLMYQRFAGQAGAFAYLLFVLLYFPCISTTAAMLRELHRGWAVFSAAWMSGVAYGTAVVFYQAATWKLHPASSFAWIGGISAVFLMTLWAMRWYAEQNVNFGGLLRKKKIECRVD